MMKYLVIVLIMLIAGCSIEIFDNETPPRVTKKQYVIRSKDDGYYKYYISSHNNLGSIIIISDRNYYNVGDTVKFGLLTKKGW